ncbi:MAG: metallophosphoesterase [Lentisphaeria bacterium]|nr:metallophosphoesterase [Lentisphaeria bacterium]
MRRHLSFSILLIILLAAPAGVGQEVALTIMQTTDLHGFITRGDEAESGGLLRLATLIDRERQNLPDDTEIIIDCGDTISGTVESLPDRGVLILDMLKAIGYDVWVPGNHELDFGVPHLATLVQQMRNHILCGNLTLYPGRQEETTFPAWKLIEKNGLRVAVIGMSASYTANWYWGETKASFSAAAAVDSLLSHIKEIRAVKPDFTILAIHQGWHPNDDRGVNEIQAIAKKLPEIDLILGGHTHRPNPGDKINHHTWYAQAGRHADALAVARVRFDLRTRHVTSLESRLVPATADVPLHKGLQQTFAKRLDTARVFSRKGVGTLGAPLQAGQIPGVDSGTSECVSRAIAEAVKAPVVIHGKLSNASFPAGPFSEGDLFALIPYENTIGTLLLTPRQLKDVLNEQLANRGSYTVNGLWGIRAICENNQVARCVWADGTGFSTGRIKVAFHSYALAGGGGRFPVLRALAENPRCEPVETGLSTRDIVRTYLKTHGAVAVSPEKWFIEK